MPPIRPTTQRGDTLALALERSSARKGPGGFTFTDLVEAGRAERASLSQLAAWLAEARSTGAVEDMGFDDGNDVRAIGPRRYRLAQSRPHCDSAT